MFRAGDIIASGIAMCVCAGILLVVSCCWHSARFIVLRYCAGEVLYGLTLIMCFLVGSMLVLSPSLLVLILYNRCTVQIS